MPRARPKNSRQQKDAPQRDRCTKGDVFLLEAEADVKEQCELETEQEKGVADVWEGLGVSSVLRKQATPRDIAFAKEDLLVLKDHRRKAQKSDGDNEHGKDGE